MKKRLGLIIVVVIAVLIVGLLVWRLWPQTASSLIDAKENAGVTSCSAEFNSTVNGLEIYRMDGQAADDVLEILESSGYRPDFRNLLPWGIDGVSSDRNHDGRTVRVFFGYEGDYADFLFLSRSLVVVTTAEKPGNRIYHPTNRETMDKLITYLHTYGTEQ